MRGSGNGVGSLGGVAKGVKSSMGAIIKSAWSE